jgi:hypothetical protein
MPGRRARRSGVTLISLPAARKEADLCAACRERLTPGEPVAWTLGKRRIHESCIGTARIANAGRRKVTPTEAADLTESRPLCAACFALERRISLAEARRLMILAAEAPSVRVLPVMCSSCRREGDIVCHVSTRSGASTAVRLSS